MSDLPDLLAHRDAALALLRRRPACVFTDIDGTLSPIVADPLAATVPPATRLALEALSERISVVALTGRSVADARRVLGLDTVVYSGNHGAEWWEDGVASLEPAVEPYVLRVRETAQAVERGIAIQGTLLEDKGASLSVHYRNAPEPATARAAILRFLRTHAGDMAIREGKMVVEVRPPVPLSKGEAVRSFIQTYGAGIGARARRRSDGRGGVRGRTGDARGEEVLGLCVAVATADAPAELLAAADYALADTQAVGQFLAGLTLDL